MAFLNIPEKLKLNRFKYTAIPKPSVILGRFGLQASPESMYSGEEIVKIGQSKTDIIAETDREFMNQLKNIEEDGN